MKSTLNDSPLKLVSIARKEFLMNFDYRHQRMAKTTKIQFFLKNLAIFFDFGLNGRIKQNVPFKH